MSSSSSRKPTAIILLSCRDQKGIVASVSSFIYKNNGNIVKADMYTDPESLMFFMRIEWELEDFKIPRENIKEEFEKEVAKKFDMNFEIRFSDYIPRIAIFVSKQDHCLYDLLWRWKVGEIRAEIPLIISNHEDLKHIAQQFNIPFYVFPKTPETKLEQEKKEIELLKKHNIDLIILARYMQILSPYFVDEYPNKIINIHHSFLPAFKGAKPYYQAYLRGVKIIGATAHYVTEELDQGPIIEQDVIRVSHKDTVDDLIRKGRDLEKIVLARAVRLHLENKILVYRNRTIIFE